ncbi:MAG: hypothetical protein HYR85_21000 [Planctomycetes bacterium]|nr:hypothetical protein [Planctomycetota bacterium]
MPAFGSSTLKRSQACKGLAILLSARRRFAGDNVVEVTDRKAVDVEMAAPGILESLERARCEHEIEIERSVSQLDEILATFDFMRLVFGQRKPRSRRAGGSAWQLVGERSTNQSASWVVLGKPSRIAPALPMKRTGRWDVANLQRLAVFKRGHSQANPASFSRTIAGTAPLCRTRETSRRPRPACMCE